MGADHNDKKRKISEESASSLPSSPLPSSSLRTSSADLTQTMNSYESLYYDTDDEFVSTKKEEKKH